jgi:hypothetical protein
MVKRRNVLLTMVGMFTAGIAGAAKALGGSVDGILPVPSMAPSDLDKKMFDDGTQAERATLGEMRKRAIRRAIRDKQTPTSNYVAAREELDRVPTPSEISRMRRRAIERAFSIV